MLGTVSWFCRRTCTIYGLKREMIFDLLYKRYIAVMEVLSYKLAFIFGSTPLLEPEYMYMPNPIILVHKL